MVGKVEWEIKGAKELEAVLKDMGPKVAVRLGDKALRAGARVVVKEARRLAPYKTGALRKSIAVVRGRNVKPDERSVVIGFKRPGRRYAHLLEFGTVHASARSFMRPALDTKAREALDIITATLADGILRQEWRKALAVTVAGEELFSDGE